MHKKPLYKKNVVSLYTQKLFFLGNADLFNIYLYSDEDQITGIQEKLLASKSLSHFLFVSLMFFGFTPPPPRLGGLNKQAYIKV